MPLFGQYIAKRPEMNLAFDNSTQDSSMNSYSVINNGVTFTTNQLGESNKAGSFSSSDYLDLGDNASTLLPSNSNTKTISVFCKMNSDVGSNPILGYGNNDNLSKRYFAILLNSNDALQVYTQPYSTSYGGGHNFTGKRVTFDMVGLELELINWNHFLYIIVNKTISLYVNGIFISSGTVTYFNVQGEQSNVTSWKAVKIGLNYQTGGNQYLDLDMSNYTIHSSNLGGLSAAILNKQKGRIRI